MDASPNDAGGGGGQRTAADLTGLLVELARARKGLSFYDEGHPARNDLIDRAWMAWQLELQRAGAIELACDGPTLSATGEAPLLPAGPVDEVRDTLAEREVETLRIEPQVTREAFTALLDLLGRTADYVASCGGLGPALATRCDRGIVVNGCAPAPETPAAAATATTPTSLGASLLVSTRDLVAKPEAGGQPDEEKPELDEAPLRAPAHDDEGETLRRTLVRLDDETGDDAYAELAGHVAERATLLSRSERHDDVYRVVLVLCDHAVGDGVRSVRQALTAHETLARLCRDGVLDDVIERACSSDGARSVRASRALLQLGEDAADRVLEQVVSGDAGPERTAQLRAILTALGTHAVRGLERALAEAPAAHATAAAQLCADSQNPALVPALARSLRRPEPALRRAAVAALTRIGGEEAGDALLNEITRDDAELIRTCARGLGKLGEDRFVLPLLAALDRAERRGDAALAADLVRELGRLGSDRAVPRLASMLRRRRLLARAPKIELQMRALETLAALPGREARRTIEWTAQQGPRGLRDRARALLGDRSAEDVLAPGE